MNRLTKESSTTIAICALLGVNANNGITNSLNDMRRDGIIDDSMNYGDIYIAFLEWSLTKYKAIMAEPQEPKAPSLVYTATQNPVRIGDRITTFRGEVCEVIDFREPHKASSSGHVTLDFGSYRQEYYVSVISAEWINRTDR